MAHKRKSKEQESERVIAGPSVGDGKRLAMCQRGNDIEIGVLNELSDDQAPPPDAEVFEVMDECGCGWSETAKIAYQNTSGPAQVATRAYRDGHDRIFGKKPRVGLA